MKLDSDVDLKHLKVDGGMTNGDVCMKVLADVGGFEVIRPEMREWALKPVFQYLALLPQTHTGLPHLDQLYWQEPPSACLDGICWIQKRSIK